jgi:preprotein translocase subunit SecY
MKLVENSHDWSKWWSVRFSIIGGAILTLLEAFPNVVSEIIQTLPDAITDQIGTDILKTIGIVCIIASPIARVIKQSRLDKPSDKTNHEA